MKNIEHVDEQKFDRLPNFASMKTLLKNKGESRHDRYWNHDFPYDRVRRYLLSCVGLNWTKVVRNFVRLEWVSPRFRTHSKLTELVETHTFIDNGEIFYFADYCGGVEQRLKDDYNAVFYVHPSTGKLTFQAKRKKPRWNSNKPIDCIILKPYHQLAKFDGIWYYVYIEDKDIPNCGYSGNDRLLYENGKIDIYRYTTPTQLTKTRIQKMQLNQRELEKFDLKNNIK